MQRKSPNSKPADLIHESVTLWRPLCNRLADVDMTSSSACALSESLILMNTSLETLKLSSANPPLSMRKLRWGDPR